MPLFLTDKIDTHTILAIWEAKEPLHFFQAKLPQVDRNTTIHHPIKKIESTAGRFLVQQLVENLGIPYQGITKDDHGKPHLIGSDAHISISHAYPYIAAKVNTKVPTGIDIEAPKNKIIKLQHKFLNAEEQLECNNNKEKLTLYWAAKEALFKFHGRKTVSLKENLVLTSSSNPNELIGTIIDNTTKISVKLKARNLNNYWLVYIHSILTI